MPCVVTGKGQVTIPRNIRDLLNIHANDRVEFVREGARVLLVPVKTLVELRQRIRTFLQSPWRNHFEEVHL